MQMQSYCEIDFGNETSEKPVISAKSGCGETNTLHIPEQRSLSDTISRVTFDLPIIWKRHIIEKTLENKYLTSKSIWPK